MYRGETTQGQKVAISAGNGSFVVVERLEGDVPVLGEVVVYLLGHQPIVVKGKAVEVAEAVQVLPQPRSRF